jgi:hypothetical protein
LNGGGEVAGIGLDGKQLDLDFMCDKGAPHPSLETSNSCCYLASPMPSPTPSLLPREDPDVYSISFAYTCSIIRAMMLAESGPPLHQHRDNLLLCALL